MSEMEIQNTVLKNSSSLKLYLRMEGNSTDSSGNANHGTDTAVIYNASYGKFGQGANFDGVLTTGSKIVIGTTATLDFSTAFSIGGWIKCNSTPNDTAMMGKIDGTGAGYMIYFGSDTKPIIYINGAIRVTATTPLGTTNFNHVVAVWTGTVLYLYINGKMDATAAYSTAPTSSGHTFQIGTWGSSANKLPADLDDLFAFDTALSADQVHELYEGRTLGEGHPQAGLVAGYHLNGNSTDFSGNNYHLTNNGAVTFPAGKFNKAANFVVASSQSLTITDASCSALEISGAQTWCAWVKPGTLGANYCITGKVNAGFSIYHQLWQTNGNKFGFDLQGLTTTSSLLSNKSAVSGVWTYIVGVYDGSNLKIYINGNLDNSGVATGSAADTNATFGIGKSGDYARYYDGMIDEVQIYNVAKSANWVRQQYAIGVGKYY